MSDLDPAALKPGALFQGRYQVVRRIAAGGMGAVYEVVHLETKRHRALKVMLPSLIYEPALRERFRTEATAVAGVQSEHLIETFDAGVDPETDAPFLVMELLVGEDLGRLVKARGRLAPGLVVTLLAQAAIALDRTHAAGVVHRDLKPENLFLTRRDDGSPRIKILDFGIAKVIKQGAGATQTQALGTPLYMPREQIRGEGSIGPAADRYAIAQVAYTLLVGEAYFAEERRSAEGSFPLMVRISEGPSEPATRRAARAGVELPPAFDAWFAEGTAREPEDRPPSAARLVADLARALGEPVPASLSAEPWSPEPAPEAPKVQRSDALPSLAGAARTTAGGRSGKTLLRAGLAGLALLAGLAALLVLVVPRLRAPSAPARAGCVDHASCTKTKGQPARCRRDDGACVALAIEGCRVLAEPSDLASEATLWFGAMFPMTGPDASLFGEASVRAIDLARRDFVEVASGLPPARPGGPRRPIALVVCDDARSPERVASHLVDDLRVPAVLGFARSKEVLDLAASTFLPKGVLALASNTASTLRTIPHAPGQPRLVWRTTTSNESVLVPIAALIAGVVEPEIRATPAALPPGAKVRVALVRIDNASGLSFRDEAVAALRFNGKSVVGNGDAFRDLRTPDGGDDKAIVKAIDRAAAEIAIFRPHIVITAGADPRIVPAVERAWPATERFRPRYVTGMVPSAMVAFARERADLRRRILGVDMLSSTPAAAKFVLRYNGVYSPKVTAATATVAPYDAFYVLAYAVAALGEEPITGPALARAIRRLTPPGEPIEVGPGGIYPALHALGSGRSIDLVGVGTTLDFDPETGDAAADFAVYCIAPSAPGGALDVLESGLVFRARGKALEGKLRCPW
jgi:ABC-type branched-subunit amino acid transport system substrate-binding protein/tRNA A-37 threonylcarbamoyl transferase component Bud32